MQLTTCIRSNRCFDSGVRAARRRPEQLDTQFVRAGARAQRLSVWLYAPRGADEPCDQDHAEAEDE
jgi:hypothetical protein